MTLHARKSRLEGLTFVKSRRRRDKDAFEYKAFQKAIIDYWDVIDDAVTGLLESVGDPMAAGHFSALGQSFDHKYGHGYWGVAYPTAFKRWAVKITTDPLEGPVAQLIIDTKTLHDHAGVARFLKVWQLRKGVTLEGMKLPIYVIVREDIDRVTVSEVPAATIRGINAGLDMAEEMMLAAIDGEMDEADDLYDDWIDTLKAMRSAPLLWHPAEFMIAIARHKVVMHDVTLGNLGWRRHSFRDFALAQAAKGGLVIHDVGHSSNGVGRREIDKLPVLTRNPPIDILG